MFENITQTEMLLSIIFVIIIFLVGFKTSSFFSDKRSKREMKLIDKARDNSSGNYRKLLDEENVEVLSAGDN